MFVFSEEKNSDSMLDEIVSIQEEIFSELGLHCRVLELPFDDLGAPAYRKIDIEAWMPGKNDYGEVSGFLFFCCEFFVLLLCVFCSFVVCFCFCFVCVLFCFFFFLMLFCCI